MYEFHVLLHVLTNITVVEFYLRVNQSKSRMEKDNHAIRIPFAFWSNQRYWMLTVFKIEYGILVSV